VVLGLNSGGDTPEDLEAFINAFQITFPILIDNQSVKYDYRQSGAISPYPLDYVIDRAGRVAYAAVEYDPEAMIEAIDQSLTSVAPVENLPPVKSALRLDARPNPFNPRTEIFFELPRAGSATLEILDSRGHRVRRLLHDVVLPAGENSVTWDGVGDTGRALPTGLYLARLETSTGSITRKLTLVR